MATLAQRIKDALADEDLRGQVPDKVQQLLRDLSEACDASHWYAQSAKGTACIAKGKKDAKHLANFQDIDLPSRAPWKATRLLEIDVETPDVR